MPDAPTFNTDTGEGCPPCQNLSKTGWGVQSLLLLIGSCVLIGVGYLLVQLMPLPTSALPPTAPVSRSSFASPFPSTAVPSTPTPDPFAPTATPDIQLVMEVTRTPIPTPTLSPYEATLQAGQATATAMAAPISCERTTVTPGERKTCFWEVVLPLPTPMPTYPPCETPVPAMRCMKEA